MINVLGLNIHYLDFFAILWFFVVWVGYSAFADRHQGESLVSSMHKHREVHLFPKPMSRDKASSRLANPSLAVIAMCLI